MNGLFYIRPILSALGENHAYLDPGSGSFILQLILAAILGGLLVLRTFWTKIKDGVKGLFSPKQDEEGDETE
jgi:hypothetical protein